MKIQRLKLDFEDNLVFIATGRGLFDGTRFCEELGIADRTKFSSLRSFVFGGADGYLAVVLVPKHLLQKRLERQKRAEPVTPSL
ncbi:hypothetical protein [Thermosulfurimonas sp. F29]|uniref:hypothetical protein n=1 Tax=Thermosulfurimonas sp. F29 TaxID=2867247 RepID=UPI001C83A8CC|nr:hypothetical protein [Thermosulfurimonas sp. F29]MBX6423335.1 hypothetical protein [Thermosulfurimonas sp. F29]